MPVRGALLATLALGLWAVPALAEEASPELGRCVAVAAGTGTYSKPSCTKSASRNNSYDWIAGAEKPGFTESSNKKIVLELVEEVWVTCAAQSGSGSYEGDDHVRGLVMVFTGCKEEGGACSSTGARAGEIVSSTLEGNFVWTSRPKRDALDIFPAEFGGPLMSFTCPAYPVSVTGSVLELVKGDKMLPEITIGNRAKDGEQVPQSYETAEGAQVVDRPEIGYGEEIDEPQPGTLMIPKVRIKGEEPLEVNPAL